MDIAIERLNNLFLPYDMKHLLFVWALLTAFLLVYDLIISASGIYATSRQFWKVQLFVLAGAYMLSGVSFLLFHFNVIGTIMALLCLAFMIIGDVGAKGRANSAEDEWLVIRYARKPSQRDSEQ